MNKTFSINIAGIPFVIDDDAYALLSEYLDAIGHAFGKSPDNQELLADIEARIAELLLEYTSKGSCIVTSAQVEDVIRRIGQPEEMIEEDIDISVNKGYSSFEETGSVHVEEEGTQVFSDSDFTTPPPYNDPKKRKKLYRDTQNSLLGGVCSGFSWYFDWDPTIVRIILIVLIACVPFAFFFGTFTLSFALIIAYIILWICLPEAVTPVQRMEMMGKDPTIENIGKTVTDNFKEDRGMNTPSPQQQSLGVISKIFDVVLKCIIGFGMTIGIFIFISLIIGLAGCIFFLIMMAAVGQSGFMPLGIFGNDTELILWSVACGIGGIFFIGTPIFLLLRMAFNKKHKPLPALTKWVCGILCVSGLCLAAFSTGKIIRECDRPFIHHIHTKI